MDLGRMICSKKNPEAVAVVKETLAKIDSMSNAEIYQKITNNTTTLPQNYNVFAETIRTNAYNRMFEVSPGTELSACVANDLIWRYLPPFLFVIGTVGNLLSFIVLCQRSMIQISSYIYLATLSMVDESVLLFGLLRYWIDSLIGREIESMSSVTCKLSQILGISGSWLSVWLIVALTSERVLVISFPLHAHRYAATPRRAKLITFAMSFIFIVINCHFIHTVDVYGPPIFNATNSTGPPIGPNAYKCNFHPSFVLFQKLWAWIDAIMYSYLPFSLITVMNVIILYQVYKASRSRSRMMQGRRGNGNHTSPYVSKMNGANQQQATGDNGRQLTVMLLVVSICFLCTTTPIVIVKALPKTYSKDSNAHRVEQYQKDAVRQLLDTIAAMLMYSNHAMNFFLYCATGRKFRHTLKRLCHQDTVHGRERYNTTQVYYSSDRRSARMTQPMTSVSNLPSPMLMGNRENVEMRELLRSDKRPRHQ